MVQAARLVELVGTRGAPLLVCFFGPKVLAKTLAPPTGGKDVWLYGNDNAETQIDHHLAGVPFSPNTPTPVKQPAERQPPPAPAGDKAVEVLADEEVGKGLECQKNKNAVSNAPCHPFRFERSPRFKLQSFEPTC